MEALNEYIRKFDEDTDIKELEKFDYVVYTRPDGITYYGAITRNKTAIDIADNRVSGIKDYLFLLAQL